MMGQSTAFQSLSPATRRKSPSAISMSSSGSDDLSNILKAHQQWKSKMMAQDPKFFSESGEAPKYMWIGKIWRERVVVSFSQTFLIEECADLLTGSLDVNVPAHEIMGQEAKDVLAYKNVANMVSNSDMSLLSALEEAVAQGFQNFIVCGNYDCASIRAASKVRDSWTPLSNWMSSVRDM